ncbi:MAG: hypothetical protein JJ979_26190, partial [Roseibium sp.]|nr:hypothetical protein [Roseibium sp.]
MTRTLRLGLFLLISFLTLGSALAEAVRLQPGRGVAELKPFLTYHSDPTASLGQVLRLYRADGFQPVLDTSMMDWNYAP